MVRFKLGKKIEKEVFCLSQACNKEKILNPNVELNLIP